MQTPLSAPLSTGGSSLVGEAEEGGAEIPAPSPPSSQPQGEYLSGLSSSPSFFIARGLAAQL